MSRRDEGGVENDLKSMAEPTQARWPALLGAVLAALTMFDCAGRVEHRGGGPVDENAAGAKQGPTAGGAGMPMTPAPSVTPPPNPPPTPAQPATPVGCPDASWTGQCQVPRSFLLDLKGPSMMSSGAWSEPVQVPNYGQVDVTKRPNDPLLPPEQWDRSTLPAGACVFRVHGVSTSCLGTSPVLSYGGCMPQKIAPQSYYELHQCEQGIAPGCASAEALGRGDWWYAVTDPRTPDEFTVVICAPICWQAGAGGAMCLYGD